MSNVIVVSRGERYEFDPESEGSFPKVMEFLIRHIKTAIAINEAIVIEFRLQCSECGRERGIGIRIPQLPISKLDEAEDMAKELLEQGLALLLILPEISVIVSLTELADLASQIASNEASTDVGFWGQYMN